MSCSSDGEREAYELAVAARKALLEHVEDTLFLHHPLAKAFAEKGSEQKERVTKKKQG